MNSFELSTNQLVYFFNSVNQTQDAVDLDNLVPILTQTNSSIQDLIGDVDSLTSN